MIPQIRTLNADVQIGFPHTAILGRLPGTNVYRNVKQYPEAKTHPGLLIVRVDAPFYFASVSVRLQLKGFSHDLPSEPISSIPVSVVGDRSLKSDYSANIFRTSL